MLQDKFDFQREKPSDTVQRTHRDDDGGTTGLVTLDHDRCSLIA